MSESPESPYPPLPSYPPWWFFQISACVAFGLLAAGFLANGPFEGESRWWWQMKICVYFLACWMSYRGFRRRRRRN